MTNLKSVWPSLFKSTKAMTMNQAKLMEEYEATKAHLESLGKLLEATPKYLQRAPEEGQYYFVVASNNVIFSRDNAARVIQGHEQAGNYFLKQSHAYALSEHRKKWGKVERLIIEFNEGWEPDWSNPLEYKGRVSFHHRPDRWTISSDSAMQGQGTIHCDFTRKNELLELLNEHFPNGPE